MGLSVLSKTRPDRFSGRFRFVVIVLSLGFLILWKTNLSPCGRRVNASQQYLITLPSEEFDWNEIKPSENITWTHCYNGQGCAKLSLPLDYLITEGPKTDIALRIIYATDLENYQGTILMNPGSPGGSGTNRIGRYGTRFDPRGIGASMPSSQCFESQNQLNAWSLYGITLLSAEDNFFSTQQSREAVVASLCQRSIAGKGNDSLEETAEEWGIGRFMFTASVATDMLKITEKLGQEKLQYWGFAKLWHCFGTISRSYVSRQSRPPDHRWGLRRRGLSSSQLDANLDDIDKTVSSFYEYCQQAGPEKCPIYAPTPSDIRDRFEALYTNLSLTPIPVPFAPSGSTVITHEYLHQLLFQATYSPLTSYRELAELIVAMENNDQTALEEEVNEGLSHRCSCDESPRWMESLSSTAFHGDSVPESLAAYHAYFRKLREKSSFFAQVWGKARLRCAQWKIRSKWRYTDPLAANATSFPLLILSTVHDPVCPLSDARRVQTRYADSALVVQNSYGHCSISSPSCTAKHVRAYFQDGKLPEEGTVCEVDELPFIGDVGPRIVSAEDRELLEALKELTSAVPTFGL